MGGFFGEDMVGASIAKKGHALSTGTFLLATTVVVMFITLVPLVFLIYQTFFTPEYAGRAAVLTLKNYRNVFTDPVTLDLLKNSSEFAFGSSVIALFIGGAMAWITERTRTPGRQWMYLVNMVPLVLPGILSTMAWVFLLSPKIGLLNLLAMKALFLEKAPFNVYSMGGMVWIQGTHWAPFAFITLAGTFRAMNPDLEEAATVSGASIWHSLRLVTLPLNLPALISLFLILIVRGLENFVVPAVIGIPAGIDVFTSKIYEAIAKSYPTNLGLASTYSIVLMIVTSIGLGLYYMTTRESSSFATITGKGYRARLIDVGRWHYFTLGIYIFYVVISILLPLIMLLWVSVTPYSMAINWKNFHLITFHNYVEVFNYPGVVSAMFNTLYLSLLASAAIVFLGVMISFIVVKLKVKGGRVLDTLGTLPLTFPGTVVGVALATLYLRLPIGIYGTVWILLIAFVTRFLPYGVRAANSSLIQVHAELEEAAAISGASAIRTLALITMPVVLSAMVGTFIYIMTLVIREFPSVILLYGPRSRVIAVQLFEMWESASFNQCAALGVFMILFLSALAFVMRRFQTKEG